MTNHNQSAGAWDITERTGYVPKTTFWQEICAAESIGKAAIKHAFARIFNESKGNVLLITELANVLYDKMLQYFDTGKSDLYKIYSNLWLKVDSHAMRCFKNNRLKYYRHGGVLPTPRVFSVVVRLELSGQVEVTAESESEARDMVEKMMSMPEPAIKSFDSVDWEIESVYALNSD